jgi:hypothetical protein
MRPMKTEEQPINISGHIEWRAVNGLLEIRTFSLLGGGGGGYCTAAKGSTPQHGDTFKNGSTCLI